MTKVIDSTNLGRLVTDIKDKIKGKFWPKDEVVQVDLATVATSGDYNDLINKPTAYVGSKIYVGTCPTAAATATKVVTVETFPLQNDLPVVGTTIAVKFSNTNTASTPKLNVNGTGAKSIYYNTAVVTSTSAIYGGTANRYSYYMWDGTNWVWVNHGTDNNDNTLAYNVRTNARRKHVDSACYRYRLLFTSTDGMKWVPSNNSTSTNATASRTVNQTPIDPFGPIAYYGSTTALSSGGSPGASTLYEQYATITLGYSFNRTGAALTLSSQKPIYIKCAPQSNGSAIIDSTTPYVQALPSTDDGKIYIYLGTATSATAIDFELYHPVYYYKDGAIRIWTNANTTTNLSDLSDVSSTSPTDGQALVWDNTNETWKPGTIQSGDPNAVLFTSQSLTSAQKAQARTNIGATADKTLILSDVPAEGDYDIPNGDIWPYGDAYELEEAFQGKFDFVYIYKESYYDDVSGANYFDEYTLSPIILHTNPDDGSGALYFEVLNPLTAKTVICYIYRGPTGSIIVSHTDSAPTDVVKYSAQSLTDAQKLQARTNIGAGTYSKPSGGIPASDLASGVIPDISGKEDSSNKVTSLSASSTDTEYPSAKAVFDFVTDDEYTVATALNEINDKLNAISPQKIQYIQPSGGLVPNIFYNLGTLSGNVTIDLAIPIDSDIENEYKFCFITVSPAPSITWSNYITHWAGNCLDVGTHTPIIDANSVYEVSVLDGFAVIIKYD